MLDAMNSAMRRLVALSGMVVLFSAVPAMACTVPSNAGELAHRLLHEINQERARYKLPGFRMSPRLTRAARGHACDNANHNRLSHVGTDGSRVGARVIRAGYDFRFLTENVALGHRRPEQVLKAWLHSSSHRQNLLEAKTTELGVGVALGRDGRLHWVMNGGLR